MLQILGLISITKHRLGDARHLQNIWRYTPYEFSSHKLVHRCMRQFRKMAIVARQDKVDDCNIPGKVNNRGSVQPVTEAVCGREGFRHHNKWNATG